MLHFKLVYSLISYCLTTKTNLFWHFHLQKKDQNTVFGMYRLNHSCKRQFCCACLIKFSMFDSKNPCLFLKMTMKCLKLARALSAQFFLLRLLCFWMINVSFKICCLCTIQQVFCVLSKKHEYCVPKGGGVSPSHMTKTPLKTVYQQGYPYQC